MVEAACLAPKQLYASSFQLRFYYRNDFIKIGVGFFKGCALGSNTASFPICVTSQFSTRLFVPLTFIPLSAAFLTVQSESLQFSPATVTTPPLVPCKVRLLTVMIAAFSVMFIMFSVLVEAFGVQDA